MKAPFRLAGLVLAFASLTACTTPEAPVRTSDADATLARWVEMLGGEQQLRQLASLETRQVFEFKPGDRKIDVHVRRVASGRYRFDAILPQIGEVNEGFDGIFAWRRNDVLGFGKVPPLELLTTLQTDDFLRAIKIRVFYQQRMRLADTEIEGRTCRVLQMIGLDNVEERWFFDAETGALRLVSRPAGNASGSPVTMEYLGYRRVGNRSFPFMTRRTEGANVLIVRYSEIIPNAPVANSLFSPPPAQIEEAKKAEQILARYVDSMGGAEAIKQVNSRVTKSNVEITTSGVKLRTVVSQKRPNLILSEQETSGLGHSAQGFDGHTGWASSDLQGFRTLAGVELQQMTANADLRVDAQLPERCPLRKFLGAREVNGRRTQALALASMQGIAGTYYFDEENGRLLRVESVVSAGPQSSMTATFDFSDFREVNGITLPFMTVMTNPAVRMVTKVESVENNVALDDAIFRPRRDD